MREAAFRPIKVFSDAIFAQRTPLREVVEMPKVKTDVLFHIGIVLFHIRNARVFVVVLLHICSVNGFAMYIVHRRATTTFFVVVHRESIGKLQATIGASPCVVGPLGC